MHEMAITQSVVDAVCERADGRTVHSIRLQVGRLCAVVPDAMQFCFELVTRVRSRRALGSTSRSPPGLAHCRSCDTDFPLQDLILLCRAGVPTSRSSRVVNCGSCRWK